MKKITLNGKEYLLLDIPDDTIRKKLGIFCGDKNVNWKLTKLCKKPFINFNANGKVIYNERLPITFQYLLIGKISDIVNDEDVCKELVEQQWGTNYKDYDKVGKQNNPFMFEKATDSFLSYLQSIGLDMTKQYLLIQKL